MKGRFFITGSDTDAGKTYVTCRLLEHFGQQSQQTLGLKPLASGVEQRDQHWVNGDTWELAKAASVKLPLPIITPISLRAATAPHIAAARENISLTAEYLHDACQPGLSTLTDLTLIEGAGGWSVPLNQQQRLSDFVRLLDCPVILVVGVRLGCLNHAELTARAIVSDGCQFYGWIANQLDSEMPFYDDYVTALTEVLACQPLYHFKQYAKLPLSP